MLQVKAILMAVYFAADHVVWANQAGIYTNKESVDRCGAHRVVHALHRVHGIRTKNTCCQPLLVNLAAALKNIGALRKLLLIMWRPAATRNLCIYSSVLAWVNRPCFALGPAQPKTLGLSLSLLSCVSVCTCLADGRKYPCGVGLVAVPVQLSRKSLS